MAIRKKLVSETRNYLVQSVAQAKSIASSWLSRTDLVQAVKFGLPEIDDRYNVWRVPLRNGSGARIGEVVIDARTTEIDESKSTRPEILEARLLHKTEGADSVGTRKRQTYQLSTLRNTIGLGDCLQLMDDMPGESVDLIFTSPPYFNARPEYSEFEQYEKYLFFMRQAIRRANRVLGEGRFFVMNTAPVLIRRSTRNESSRRIAVPFDLHRIFIEEGFDFIDDIIWVKPEGAGWATGRGRRFAADRNPLQYKAVPLTEYVLVYRKHTDLLIDWHIRNHPKPELVQASKIGDHYERTNIWRIQPATNAKHPAAFPLELAWKVISYYSFKEDVVLDPFAGSGTVGEAAAKLGRRFVLFEISPQYVEVMRDSVADWMGKPANDILWLGCEPARPALRLFEPKGDYACGSDV